MENSTTVFSHFSANPESAVINIHAIFNGIFQCVVDNDIIIEKRDSLRDWSGCQANDFGCFEIIQYLSPVTIDRSMALVNDDQIEIIGRKQWIGRQTHHIVLIIVKSTLFVIVINIVTLQQRKQSLNRGNNHIAV